MLSLLLSLPALAQTDKVYTFVEKMPEAPYDVDAFLKSHIQYPEKAAHNVQGVVYLKAVIDVNGKVTKPEVTKGIGYDCDEEAVRVVKLLPDWVPGRQGGKPVAVSVQLAVRFKVPPPAFHSKPGDSLEAGNQAFRFVEVMPRPGYDLDAYLAKNTLYPTEAKQKGITGKVYVDFQVDTTGATGHVRVTKGLGYSCDVEAVRVITTMPAWQPGRQAGRKVPVWITQPVTFAPPKSK